MDKTISILNFLTEIHNQQSGKQWKGEYANYAMPLFLTVCLINKNPMQPNYNISTTYFHWVYNMCDGKDSTATFQLHVERLDEDLYIYETISTPYPYHDAV